MKLVKFDIVLIIGAIKQNDYLKPVHTFDQMVNSNLFFILNIDLWNVFYSERDITEHPRKKKNDFVIFRFDLRRENLRLKTTHYN